MIIVDTSVWVDHLDHANLQLASLLELNEILMHPYVVGELLLGNVRNRDQTTRDLMRLPLVLPARHIDVMTMISSAQLHGSGIGYVDAHLATSACLMGGVLLWSRDKRLNRIAERLGIAAELA